MQMLIRTRPGTRIDAGSRLRVDSTRPLTEGGRVCCGDCVQQAISKQLPQQFVASTAKVHFLFRIFFRNF